MIPARRTAETPTERKRAERQRRKEAGEVRVEVWFAADEAEWLKQVASDNDNSVSEIVRWCVATVMRDRK